MKHKLSLVVLTLLLPATSFAGLLDGEKKYEVIGIVTFAALTIIGLFVYYVIWKNNKSKGGDKFVYKTVEYVQNGKKYVKYKKMRVVEDKKAKNAKSPLPKPAITKASVKPAR